MKLQYRLKFNSTLQLSYAASNGSAGCLPNTIHYCYTTLVDNIKMHCRKWGCDTGHPKITAAGCCRHSTG